MTTKIINNTVFKIFKSRSEIPDEILQKLHKAAKKTYPKKEPLLFLRDKLQVHPEDNECFVCLLSSKENELYDVVSCNEFGEFFYGHYCLDLDSALKTIMSKIK